jgi:tRNA1(Val) A37 N6-methylase TrmN6
VEKANQGSDVQIEKEESLSDEHVPSWMPQRSEELCNLVGTWRILQRVGSHRWTTDDLVTAHVASREVTSSQPVKYLDLGTGNASVLQMVTWALLKDNRSVDSTGVEARLEAVNLARRSLSFNLGKDSSIARIVHGDFRDVSFSHQFDLVTGTPPYFRVDFAVTEDAVVSAVINQGGMPTARQSAPARCEFRGGIEAYCEAASRVLRPQSGRFVVCENWLNHDRVVAVAEQCNLCILTQVQVHGRHGRDTLFCVYVMKLKDNDLTADTKREDLAVRDHKGNWTMDYRQSVLNEMSIPDPADSLSSGNAKCV